MVLSPSYTQLEKEFNLRYLSLAAPKEASEKEVPGKKNLEILLIKFVGGRRKNYHLPLHGRFGKEK